MFDDRIHAGKELGRVVAESLHDAQAVVLALPRGGVPVAVQVAKALHAELDVFLVRKLGVPGREELAFGAISTGGVRVMNRAVILEMDLSNDAIEQVIEREQAELARRERAYRQGSKPIEMRDRVAILVDDGLATGATMLAAVRAVRLQKPKTVVVAVPVASRHAVAGLRKAADEVICVEVPETFYAVGEWYEDFEQVTDEEVRSMLE